MAAAVGQRRLLLPANSPPPVLHVSGTAGRRDSPILQSIGADISWGATFTPSSPPFTACVKGSQKLENLSDLPIPRKYDLN